MRRTIGIRISPEERQLLVEAQKAVGYEHLGEFIRVAALAVARRQLLPPSVEVEGERVALSAETP